MVKLFILLWIKKKIIIYLNNDSHYTISINSDYVNLNINAQKILL